ncbi:hypothetical protein GCM10027168_69230 [Streptomyces capparidis]
MTSRSAARAVLAAAVLAGGLAPARRAGGIVDVLAPAFGNGCQNTYRHSSARNAVSTHPGSVAGNGVGVPVTGPLNHCGGADAPSVVNPPGVVVPPPAV